MRIIYITRTYVVGGESNNCSGFRNYTVNLLKKKYDVLVITPCHNSNSINDENGVVYVPFTPCWLDSWFERFGIYDDYLKRWVDDAESYFVGKIKPDDIIMAVSGGELGCIMLGAKLKRQIGCKLIVNFHDPINSTTVLGKKSTYKFHANRDRVLGKYLRFADRIITCTNTYKNILEQRYSMVLPCIHSGTAPCIQNVYRGFRGNVEKQVEHTIHKPLQLVYAGTMTPTQGAERFIKLFSGIDDIEITYIGNASEIIKKLVQTNNNVKILAPMPHEQYINFIKGKADIGLVALNGKEYGACVPSKIFELINLEIPIFAILPEGDAMNLINKKGYGYACSGKNKPEVQSLFKKMIETASLANIKSNMRKDKADWQMDKLFEDVYKIIDGLNQI